MFWIAVFGLVLSWMLTKFGVLSATVGILTLLIKLLLFAILIGSIAATWLWIRRKTSRPADKR